ncbi:MAG: S8 family peptidase [Kineosporiaceae bacterium]
MIGAVKSGRDGDDTCDMPLVRAVVGLLSLAGVVSGASAPLPAARPDSPTVRAHPVPATAVPLPPALVAYARGDRSDVQWSLAATHASAAWPVSTGQGIVVAVIDTGVDATNPDLAGAVLAPAHLAPATGRVVPGAGTDLQGHGTHVAGIIAARADGHGVTGVAPGASIMPIDVFTDPDVGGTQIAAAIRWAAEHGARVVNLSLGEPDLEVAADDVAPVCAAVSDAVAAGVVVVASAGNDGLGENFREAPAGCPGAIAVSSVSSSLTPSVWSSFDGAVSVAAPGDDVYSTVPPFVSRLGWATMSGTSMAAPFVSGVAALLLAGHPDWTPAQVRDRIERTATDVGPPGADPRTGAGVVDPAAAVGVPAPAVTPVPHLAVAATGYPTGFGPGGDLLFGATYLSWVPDPSLAVTGYRLTRFDASGTTTVDVPASDVRHVFPGTAGGYTVTALTASGDLTSAPVWFSADDDGMPPAAPVLPATGLRARWGRGGSVTVIWALPPGDEHVDRWSLVLDGTVIAGNDRPGRIPSTVRIPPAAVPAGDVGVAVMLGSTRDGTSAAAVTALGAAAPLSGRAVPAGRGRYLLDQAVAPSWARKACGRPRCSGVAVAVISGRHRTTAWTDADGGLRAVVVAARGAHRLAVRVEPVRRRHRALRMARLLLPVS